MLWQPEMTRMEIKPDTRAARLSKHALWKAVVLWLAVVAVLTLAIELVYRGQVANELSQLRQSAEEVISLEAESIRGWLGSATADLLFLTRQNELMDFVRSGDADALDAVTDEYVVFSEEKGIYDQIRFIDIGGTEVARVNYNAGEPSVAPEEELASKMPRYYVIPCLVLDEGEVYISPLDLNIEDGTIEIPWKPVIRLGAPVMDKEGKKHGIVILNLLGETLLRALRKASREASLDLLLANSESYWLLGPDPEQEWGFMFYGEGIRTVDSVFPGAWGPMRYAQHGNFRTADGLFVFTTLDPIEEAASATFTPEPSTEPETEPYRWKLIAHVPETRVREVTAPIRRTWGIIHGVLALITAAASLFAARLLTTRAEARRKVEFLAKYDALTGACNRHFFEQTIGDEVARARRYRHPISFLMIDVTRFKAINDTYGHKVGDEVLMAVAAALKASVREADVVIRYGGDEFLLMFPETPGEADVARDRVLAAVDALNGSSRFDFDVILALGSARWNSDSGETIEHALACADERMYEHKESQHDVLDRR